MRSAAALYADLFRRMGRQRPIDGDHVRGRGRIAIFIALAVVDEDNLKAASAATGIASERPPWIAPMQQPPTMQVDEHPPVAFALRRRECLDRQASQHALGDLYRKGGKQSAGERCQHLLIEAAPRLVATSSEARLIRDIKEARALEGRPQRGDLYSASFPRQGAGERQAESRHMNGAVFVDNELVRLLRCFRRSAHPSCSHRGGCRWSWPAPLVEEIRHQTDIFCRMARVNAMRGVRKDDDPV